MALLRGRSSSRNVSLHVDGKASGKAAGFGHLDRTLCGHRFVV